MKVCANCFDLFPPDKAFKNLFCSERCWNQFKALNEYIVNPFSGEDSSGEDSPEDFVIRI